jgi:hypothetical protein
LVRVAPAAPVFGTRGSSRACVWCAWLHSPALGIVIWFSLGTLAVVKGVIEQAVACELVGYEKTQYFDFGHVGWLW